MIEIHGMDIAVSRGDCSPFTITLVGEDSVADGTEILFTVKRNSAQDKALIEKRIPVSEGKIEVTIRNADTKDLPFGDYEWDIRIPDMYGENEPYTPDGFPGKFTVAKVIGNVG